MNGPGISTEVASEPVLPRRRFLKSALFGFGALLLGGAGTTALLRPRERRYAGSLLGPSANIGHLLRDRKLGPPQREIEKETVIIGGGIAGLSAAWWLRRNGYEKFLLLELEAETGGNSSHGKNEISAYPWGAHYLPLPGPEARWVRTLLEELGVIRGYDSKGLPIYDELHLCADPHERLLMLGRWQDGLVPQTGITADDRREYQAFFALMEHYKAATGSDGKRAFAIPIDLSSRDPRYIELDRMTMADFMRSKGWNSSKLHWYVDYCCRDDYGVGHEQVSAWAGVHYFASRSGKGANADSQTVLTWPEGNGWLASRLRERTAEQIRSQTLVYSVSNAGDGVVVDALDVRTRASTRIRAKQAIFAAPRFVASHVMKELVKEKPSYLKELRYAPWLVANVSLRSLPEGNGAPLSWDNVSFNSRSLGYIVATHQNLTLFRKHTVLTYFLPLDDQEPGLSRKSAAEKTHQEWARLVADDLETMHRGIRDQILRIDAWVWGHGMISPKVGYLWGDDRRKMLDPVGRIHFAHTDMSGISIFEEAQYRGVRAAQKVLSELGIGKREVT